MAVTQEHAAKHINVLAVGVTPGVGVGSTIRGNNASILRDYAARGYSIYFPAGDYEIDDEIVFPNTVANVKVWGDAAQLYQYKSNKRVMYFDGCKGVEVTGMHTYGAYYIRRTVEHDKTSECHILCVTCLDVNIHNNRATGSGSYTFACRGGNTISICDNTFADGHWDTNGVETADIAIVRDATETIPAAEIIISRNLCNTNTLIGIQSLHPAKNLICTDNECITKDEAGNELVVYGPRLRKACIELQYYTDESEGNDNQDSAQYEYIIANNKVQGARYSGISHQSSTYFANNSAGIRGTINSNQIRYVALEQAVSHTDFVTNGITIANCRDVVISNNVIKDVEFTTGNTGSAGIFVRFGSDRSPTTTGTFKSAIIANNIITDCRSYGIWTHDAGDLIINGNLFRDVEKPNVAQFGDTRTRGGKTHLIGNSFVSEKDWDQSVVALTGNDPDTVVANNRIEHTGTAVGAPYLLKIEAPAMIVTGNRLLGPDVPDPADDTNARGFELTLTGMAEDEVRYNQVMIADNVIEGVEYGFFITDNSLNIGPIIHNNTLFRNVRREVWSSHQYQIWAGHWKSFGTMPGTKPEKGCNCVIYSPNSPATLAAGNWITGDVAWNSAPAAGQPMGWYCTASGQGAASTWVAMPNF